MNKNEKQIKAINNGINKLYEKYHYYNGLYIDTMPNEEGHGVYKEKCIKLLDQIIGLRSELNDLYTRVQKTN